MRKTTLFVIAIAIAATVVAAASTNQAQAQYGNMSHLKLTSSASHDSPGTHVDQVINNDIDVKITVHDPYPNPPRADWGILQFRPGDTPNFTWTCTSCSNGYFNSTCSRVVRRPLRDVGTADRV